MATTGIQTLAQRQAVIRQRLLQSNPGQFSTSPGSIVGNLFISPLAVGDVQQQAATYMVAVGESILDILALEQDQNTLQLIAQAENTTVAAVIAQCSALLDSWGGNFKAPRLGATTATGVAQLGTSTPPTQDIVAAVGKILQSSGGVQYSVTAQATMFAANAGSYYNAQLLLFILNVNIAATSPGAAGNAPAGSLTSIVTPIAGLSFVTNLAPITGGQNVETDQAYGTRLLQVWQAYGRLTQTGISYYAATQVPGIDDVYVARTGDPLSVRGAGRTDVWVQGEAISQQTDTFGAYNHPTIPNAVVPTLRPVTELTSVSSGSAVLVQDSSSAISGSVQSQDYILFTSAPTFPVQVTYQYNNEVSLLQNLYNDPDYAPAAQQAVTSAESAARTPILARQAIAVNVDYTVAIMVMPNFSAAAVQAAVVAALEAFSSALTLGETLYLDDLNEVVEGVQGVLRISGEPITFNLTGQSGVSPNPITTANNQYAQLLNVNIF
jgi:uncharacterized phage protein gp47/JayE